MIADKQQLTNYNNIINKAAACLHLIAQDINTTHIINDNLENRLQQISNSLLEICSELENSNSLNTLQQFQQLYQQLGNTTSNIKLNIGGGMMNVPGFVTIDGYANKPDIVMNINNNLLFHDNMVDIIYCSHLLEHLYIQYEIPNLLQEMYRILIPGGIVRLVVPDILRLLQAYSNKEDIFLQERNEIWGHDTSISELYSILSYMGVYGYPCIGSNILGHKFAFDYPTLKYYLQQAGFTKIYQMNYATSNHPELQLCDTYSRYGKKKCSNGSYYSLFVEAIK